MAGAALGLGLGPGVLALQLLWALALVLCLVLSRAAGRARFTVVLVALGAAVLSAALLLFPREEERPSTAAVYEIVDTFLIGRFVLLAVMSLVLLGCLFLFLIYHLMEPVYAKPLPRS
ncbi:transmembrane protein 218 [Pezoporus wallicus]|uniref:transmembrane protein 218 n=1 Tax=Pezoporus wallicus TaxID=35540 RepID=UPI00254F4DA8|nr:transmembrane protein 218 [Pezoporus wallicus]XP_061331973.1 transmembrane protein 218 [Pezoporus flaviventris]